MEQKAQGFYRRVFLNGTRQMSNAFFLGWVDANDPEPMLKIGDCDRVITFWLKKRNKAEKRNTLRKIDTLTRCMIDFRIGLYRAWGLEAPEL